MSAHSAEGLHEDAGFWWRQQLAQHMNEAERDRSAYSLGMPFLLDLNAPGIDTTLLSNYLNPPESESSSKNLSDLYRRILESAQNANMKATVIGKSIGGVSKLSLVLQDFDPVAVLATFQSPDDVLSSILDQLQPTGKIRTTYRSLWPKYCQTLLSAATFLNQFATVSDFHAWVRFFDEDTCAKPALPMSLEREMDGFGFAFACDFLKVRFGRNCEQP